MSTINTQAIQSLRRETMAGIVDCRNALVQAQGNMEKAVELLLQRGFQIAEKKTERMAAEGAAYAAVIEGRAVLVEVNTETDFVAENQDFTANIRKIAETISRHNPSDTDVLLQCDIPGENMTVATLLQRMTLAFREKLILRRFAVLDDTMPVAYTHGNGQYGVILTLSADGPVPEEQWLPIGRELALQIAASSPRYISRDHIAHTERDAIVAAITDEMQADPAVSGKPAPIREKILAGRIEKFYRTSCLLEQPFIKNADETVAAYLAAATNSWDFPVTVNQFVRYEKAEGLAASEEKSNLAYAQQLAKDAVH